MIHRLQSIVSRSVFVLKVGVPAALAGAATSAAGRFCEAHALGTHGSWLDLVVVGLSGALPVLGLPATLLVGPLLTCFPSRRAVGRILTVAGLPFLVSSSWTYSTLPDGRPAHFARFDERMRPLLAAVKSYTDDHGAPPPSLDALVPTYLGRIPPTGLGLASRMKYEVRDALVLVKPTSGSFDYRPAPWGGARRDWIMTVDLPSLDPVALTCTSNLGQEFVRYGFQVETFGDWTLVRDD